jgi:hypothetical protein
MRLDRVRQPLVQLDAVDDRPREPLECVKNELAGPAGGFEDPAGSGGEEGPYTVPDRLAILN